MADRALRHRILTIRLAIIAIAIVSAARLLPHPVDPHPVIADLPATGTTYSYVMTAPDHPSPPRTVHVRSGRLVADANARTVTLAPAAPATIRYRVVAQ